MFVSSGRWPLALASVYHSITYRTAKKYEIKQRKLRVRKIMQPNDETFH